MIRNATSEDSLEICEIYNYYILHTHSTFETDPVSPSEIENRIGRVQNEFELPWLVFEEGNKVIGYAYATQWKARTAYAQTVETTVYLQHEICGKGFGRKLYQHLVEQLKDFGYHAILGGIALPNEASVSLHEKLGYVKVAQLKEVGYKFNRRIDVGYWELLIK